MSPTSSKPPQRVVACPTCGGDSIYAADNPFRPFCSARCKNVDFGAWASESYRLAARPSPSASIDDDKSLEPGESSGEPDSG